MLKHAHREFPSDIFLLLETVGAKLTIGIHICIQMINQTALVQSYKKSCKSKRCLAIDVFFRHLAYSCQRVFTIGIPRHRYEWKSHPFNPSSSL